MKLDFAGRTQELEVLDALWRRTGAQLLVLFARSGWSDGAIAYQTEIAQQPATGQNWRTVGMRLLDLTELDRDLAAWSV